MAALTANSPYKSSRGLGRVTAPVLASAHIYQSALVCCNSSGYAVPAADSAGYVYMGQAVLEANNAGGSSGAINVEINPPASDDTSRYLQVNASNPGQTWFNQHVFLIDDQTCALAASTTNDVILGRVIGVGASWVIVDTEDKYARATS
jgi:hypothetical protein